MRPHSTTCDGARADKKKFPQLGPFSSILYAWHVRAGDVSFMSAALNICANGTEACARAAISDIVCFGHQPDLTGAVIYGEPLQRDPSLFPGKGKGERCFLGGSGASGALKERWWRSFGEDFLTFNAAYSGKKESQAEISRYHRE